MDNISRRRFVRMLAGVPFVSLAAPQLSGTSQHDSLSRSQIEAIELILHKLDFPPGRHFAYSNCAYNLAGLVLARVSKMSYIRFIDVSFFQPLGMTSSYALGSREDANFAEGYSREADGWKSQPATPADKA